MYIFLKLGNNYSRGENMKSRRINRVVMPVVYGGCVVVFLVGMYFIQRFANNLMFSSDEELEYVDGEITENNSNNDIPVVNTSVSIVRPYWDSSVSIAKTFYDYEGTSEEQEKSIIYYEDIYMQNSGVDYTSENVFDVISILDGTVISIEDDNLLGTTVEVRHSNNLISVYQGLSEVVVEENMLVLQGQAIAKSGTSNINKDLGNHLHFELYHNGMIVNPEEYYNKNINEL